MVKEGEKNKLRVLFLIVLISLVSLDFTIVSAALDLRINGSINGYASDVILKINSNSDSGIDVYDMYAPSSPSNYSSFSSTVSGSSLAIDSWATNPRTVNLVYSISSAQTGSFSLLWNSVSGSDYGATLTDYGTDSTYTTSVGSADMVASSSYTRNLEGESDIYVRVVIDDYTAPTTPDTGGGNGGGGGGGGGVEVVSGNLVIDSEILEVPGVINTVKTRKIELFNDGSKSLNVRISLSGLNDIISIKETSFTLIPGERKLVEVKLIAPEEPGIYTGKVRINGKDVLVSFNVNTKELLFDVGIVVPDEFKMIDIGDKLASQVTLIPMGEDPRLDVTLNYVIKDFDGRVFLSESETILVENQKTFKKEFPTQNIPQGDYILGLELIYPNGVATSTSHFKIGREEVPKLDFYKIILIAIVVGILLLILFILLVIRRYKNLKRFSRRRKK